MLAPIYLSASIPSFPAGITGAGHTLEQSCSERTFRFLCKAAQLPASTVAEIPVPFRGRILKVAGDRTFEPWTVTIINDEDFNLRSAFEGWMNSINDLSHATGITNPSSYMTNAFVATTGQRKSKKCNNSHPQNNKKSASAEIL